MQRTLSPVMVTAKIPGAPVHARKPHPSPIAVARALASAFLACDEWTPRALIDAAAVVLGTRRRWLAPLVGDVMTAFNRPPTDSARQLAALIGISPAFRRAIEVANKRCSAIALHHSALPPSLANRTGYPIPLVNTVADLADLLELRIGQLEWFADTKNWNRRARPGDLHHYRYEWHQRPGRTPRLLEIPEQRLRRTQRKLLEEVIGLVPTHGAAHGFIPGRSATTGARQHTGSEVVIALDLTTFFANVTGRRIFALLRRSGFTEAVSYTITGLATNAVPPAVLTMMPPGGRPEERFALRQALAANHLPQGSPSSPMLANLAVRQLDSRLAGWALCADASYTRYADDLAFSGGQALARRVDAFIRGVNRIVESEGHSVNFTKTRVARQGVRQTVTAIVVNRQLNIPRSEYDRLKAIIHNCVVHGPHAQNRRSLPDFRAHLLGRISWVQNLNPPRATRLREDFLRIRW